MMNGPSVSLCPTVTRDQAFLLMEWMKDEEVCQYLSDSQNVSTELQQLLNRVQIPDLAHFFNQNGRFYLIQTESEQPIGFVRLANKQDSSEIVITIGDKKMWGKGLGPCAIKKSMETAFFELRHEKMQARIHSDNTRAMRAFINAGFVPDSTESLFQTFSITMDRYLDIIRTASAVNEELNYDPDTCSDQSQDLVWLSASDFEKLKRYTDYQTYIPEAIEPFVEELKEEIAEAIVMAPEELPPDVVSMNSVAKIDLNGEEMHVALVFPHDADQEEGKISVLSPLGVAILGNREGDTIEKELDSGYAHICIREIVYQPEASGEYYL